MRPIWQGFITFGLVNIPVTLYSALKKFDIQLSLIDSQDKAKIRYIRVNSRTGKEVPWNRVAKGYEYTKNNYIPLKKTDFNAVASIQAQTIAIYNFTEKNNLSTLLFDRPYYLIPKKKGKKSYVLLCETLKKTKKAGISKVIIHTREYLAALIPYENALVLNLLRYPDELRKISEFEFPRRPLKAYKISVKELEVAQQLVKSMTKPWHPENYHDEYRKALEKYVENKIQRKPTAFKPKEKKKPTPNIVNFVDLLKKSLEKNESNKSQHKKLAR